MKQIFTRQAEQAIHPFELVELEGMPLMWSQDGKTAVTECPACRNNSLWVRNDGFICTHIRCSWLSGSVLALAVTKAGSVRKAAAKLKYYFPARTEHWIPQFVPEIEESYKSKRRLLEILGDSNVRRDEDILAPSWHEAMQLSWDLSRKVVFQMRPTQVEEWFKVCKINYGLRKTAPAAQGLIVPYFFSPFDIAGFLFLDPTTKQSHWFQLQDQAWSWAGWLSLIPPSNSPIFVAQSLREALNTATRSKRNIPTVVCHYRPFGLQNARFPSEKLVMSLDRSKPVLSVASRLALQSELRIDMGSNGTECWVDWTTFIREGIRQRLGPADCMTEEVMAFIQRCRPSSQVLEEVRDWFLAQHRADIASQLEAEVLDIPICTSKDGEILQRGGRYVFYDHRTGWVNDVTNFAASPEGIVTFPLSKQVFYSLRVELEGRVKEVLCPQSEMLNPSQLEPRLISAFSSSEGETAQTLPRIENRTHIKTISEHLLTSCAKKGERQGVDYCGWSYDKSIFRTPWWMISAERGLVENEFPLHPDMTDSFVYSNQISTTPGPAVELPAPVRSMMRIVFALLARTWRGIGIQQIPIADSAWTREMLSAMFGCFGQVRPFSSLSVAEKFSKGCPHYGTELERNTPAFGKLPLLNLAESGLFGAESCRIPEGFRGMFLGGVRRLVEACIAESPFPEAEKNFVPVNSLMEEGRAWETNLWGTRAKPMPLFPRAEKFFRETPLEEIKANVVADRDSRTLILPVNMFEGLVDTDDMVVEMVSICPGTEIQDNGSLSVPAVGLQKMLYDWYGEVPKWKNK